MCIGSGAPGLLLVCKQICLESIDDLYANACFYVDCMTSLARWLDMLPEKHRNAICEIRCNGLGSERHGWMRAPRRNGSEPHSRFYSIKYLLSRRARLELHPYVLKVRGKYVCSHAKAGSQLFAGRLLKYMQTVPRLPGERNWFTLAPHKEELPVDLKALRLSEDSFLPLCRSIWAKQQKVAEAHNHRVSFLRLLPEIRNRICNLNRTAYTTQRRSSTSEAQDVLAAWLRSLPQQRRGLIAEIRTWARIEGCSYRDGMRAYVLRKLRMLISAEVLQTCPANPKAQPLDLAVTSILANAGNNARSRRGRSDVLALEVGQEVGVANAVERAGAAESVDLASVAESGGADGVGAGVRGGEDLAAGGAGVDGRGHVLEDVAFGDDGGAGADFEGVAAVGVPVVVDGVEERVAADFGAAAAGVVDVVALEGYEVAGAGEVQSPVVVVVAGGGPGGGTVDLRVGNSDTLAGAVSEGRCAGGQ
ncbi:hypothetical protein L1887_55537 [Cichorium endivia]|nr:hypothetical protein L1887_55537 [Cichorium endivia]